MISLRTHRTPFQVESFLAMWKWIREGLSKEEWESLYLDQAVDSYSSGDERRHNTPVEKLVEVREEAEKKRKSWRWN